MAIAASPSAANPQRVREARSRPVAMSAQHLPPGLCRAPDDVSPEQERALATALALKEKARSWPGMARPSRRRWELMVASDEVEAWIIAWPPGGAIELHDHGGSAGAVVVVAGELLETRIVAQPSGGVAPWTNTIGAGASSSSPDTTCTTSSMPARSRPSACTPMHLACRR